jgi:hypothetical protein
LAPLAKRNTKKSLAKKCLHLNANDIEAAMKLLKELLDKWVEQ